MTQHPSVYAANIRGKATDGEVLYVFGSQRYAAAFDGMPSDMLVGESHVAHLVKDASRIAQNCGTQDARLIAILREPVARCHSQFLMRARLRTDGLSPESNLTNVLLAETDAFDTWARTFYDNVLEAPPPRATEYTGKPVNGLYEGAYHIHLSRYLHHFNATALRIYWFDDLEAHTAAVLRDALSFVGADPTGIDLDAITRRRYNTHNASVDKRPNLELAPALAARMRFVMAPFNKALAAFLDAPLPPAWL